MRVARPRWVFTLACLLAFLTAGPAPAGLITGIVVFGDSLSDTGNAYRATGGAFPPAPYSAGRFSNGPIWVQQLAAKLAVASPAPSSSGGTDYAYAGAATGATPLGTQMNTPAGYSPLTTPSGQFITNVPTLQTQVANYISGLGGGKISPNTVVTIWAGPMISSTGRPIRPFRPRTSPTPSRPCSPPVRGTSSWPTCRT